MDCCGALEFFPEMGKVLYFDGDWGVWAYTPGNNSWVALANTGTANAIAGLPNFPMTSTSVFAIYNPLQRVVLFGGGTHLYKIDSSGRFTTMRAPPITLGASNAVVSVDPSGGKNIVLSSASMYQYDSSTDTWEQLAVSLPSAMTGLGSIVEGLVETPVTTYGVIMYTKYNYAGSAVYLYKHSPPPIKPQPPASVTAN